jgi:hypothetical protein
MLFAKISETHPMGMPNHGVGTIGQTEAAAQPPVAELPVLGSS